MKNTLKDQIFSRIAKILTHDQTITVGVSGGPDSMLLLHILQDFFSNKGRKQSNICVAHYNHGQRKEAKSDQKLVEKQSKYNTFYWNPLSPKKGQSETYLRTIRHNFFEEVIKKNKSTYLFLGHNLTDRIETTLLNLVRGSGIEGFLGIKEKSTKKTYTIYRPLLPISKDIIQQYCDTNNIPYTIDTTNKQEITPRNIIRNTIIPHIQTLHNNGKQNRYNSRESIYNTLSEKSTIQNNNRETHIPHPLWGATFWVSLHKEEVSNNDRYVLYKDKYYLTKKTLVTIDSFIKSGSGHLYIGGIYIFLIGNRVHCIDGKKNFWQQKHNFMLKIKHHGKQNINGYTYTILKERIGKQLRYPNKGDIYKKKRLLKVMLNNKIPLFMRNTTPVIVDKKNIISILYP